MDIRLQVRTALLTALVTAVTLVVRIPMPATEGYINIGDAVIIAAALLFGGRIGALAGGVGSAMADLYGGYSHWVPFTLVIKGMEGFLIGAGAAWLRLDLGRVRGISIAAALSLLGTAWMVAGYFLVEWYLYSMGPALASLSGNLFQAAASLVCGLPLSVALGKSGLTGGRQRLEKALDESPHKRLY